MSEILTNSIMPNLKDFQKYYGDDKKGHYEYLCWYDAYRDINREKLRKYQREYMRKYRARKRLEQQQKDEKEKET